MEVSSISYACQNAFFFNVGVNVLTTFWKFLPKRFRPEASALGPITPLSMRLYRIKMEKILGVLWRLGNHVMNRAWCPKYSAVAKGEP